MKKFWRLTVIKGNSPTGYSAYTMSSCFCYLETLSYAPLNSNGTDLLLAVDIPRLSSIDQDYALLEEALRTVG